MITVALIEFGCLLNFKTIRNLLKSYASVSLSLPKNKCVLGETGGKHQAASRTLLKLLLVTSMIQRRC